MNLVWFRNDLRLADNPALYHASKQGELCCVFVVTQKQWQDHNDAPAKMALLRQRLLKLSEELADKHIPLKILTADSYADTPKAILSLAKTINATSLWFNHEYPLNEKRRDHAVIKLLEDNKVKTHAYHGDIVHPPGTVKTQTNTIYHVFSPFARQWRKQLNEDLLRVLPSPRKQPETGIKSDSLEKCWKTTLTYRDDLWPSSTQAINSKLNKFIANTVIQYKETRDIPNISGTSTLSPFLMCGALSVRQCIHAAREKTPDWLENAWVNELVWREFYRHLIEVYPHLSRSENFKATHKPIPWENNHHQWQAWCSGTTGYPIVDAAMKQLLQTGWMHNRLRMIVATFLTKLLLVDWRKGEQFFMSHLIDGDYASNNGGWQWAASTGADAVPYFRIFNPERQSQRFDPEGSFIKRFLPELAELDKKSVHKPSSTQRQQCAYPEPIIDYTFARQRAMGAYASAMRK